MTVAELGRRMGSRELGGWLAMERIDPIPDWWLMAGMLCATVANAAGGKRRWQAWDFFPWLRPGRTRPQSGAETQARFRARMGG